MNMIYSIRTKEFQGKRYVIGYSLARESSEGELAEDELRGPMPSYLFTEDMQPCWVIEEGTLVYDPASIPVAEQLKKELKNLLAYLSETDWYIIRKTENGQDPPVDIVEKREKTRLRINEIRSELGRL